MSSLKNLERDFMKAVHKGAEQALERQVRDLRVTCPVHGEVRDVKAKVADSFKKGEISADVCCERGRAALERALGK